MSGKGWWLFLSVFLSFTSIAKPVLKACIDEYPPYQILGNPPAGEYVSALEVLAMKLDMALVFETEPDFSHCMDSLKTGQVDILAGLVQSPQRQKDMYFLPMHQDTHYVFVTRNSAKPIEKYEDLQGRLIATAQDYIYFPRFNQDQSLHKIPVKDVHMAYKLLLAGRVDVAISSEQNLSAILGGNPNLKEHIRVHPYHELADRVVYFGLSKKSPHTANLEKLLEKVQLAFEEGAFQQAMEDFSNKNPEYYRVKPPRIAN
ncbi:transporter substrate-binding domain-containing protein [Aliiglaciecola sp. CAU 1673]|uniref:substrate-binding periplasmic protein n=1 Tax=Aliiglaciecola sp. CAU 1673 TaxID=3032595 RepID=UPI0023DBEE0B|nr:transporter substrate-binding domain-containing protein [Aliiglaciecola sp. CAU 1673]MDF2180126.1 transporter substrate-binding domain-containing protein [Aliiglaciecola sp. CAU 1673]